MKTSQGAGRDLIPDYNMENLARILQSVFGNIYPGFEGDTCIYLIIKKPACQALKYAGGRRKLGRGIEPSRANRTTLSLFTSRGFLSLTPSSMFHAWHHSPGFIYDQRLRVLSYSCQFATFTFPIMQFFSLQPFA